MDIIKSTANKCMELEKRLDNALIDKSLKVSEVKKSFQNLELSSDYLAFKILSIPKENTSTSLVIQGEIEVLCNEPTNFNISLYLDGFEVYSEFSRLTAGDVHRIQLIRALNVTVGVEQELELRVWISGGGEAYLRSYDFFIWGYGSGLELGETEVQSKLSGVEENGRYSIYLVLNGLLYGAYIWDFPEVLSFDNFNYIGEALAISPVCFPYVSPLLDYGGEGSDSSEETEEDSRELPALINFVVKPNGDLMMFSGELSTLDDESGVLIATDVVAVSSTYASYSGVIVVAYAVGKSVYYFTYDGETRSEPFEIFSFKENILELSLVRNCQSTSFLVVGLESGKNYLFSSVTEVVEEDKSSKIYLSMSVEFN